MKKNYDDRSWSFLIASPAFEDPVFEESVILLLEDTKEGAIGVVINSPLEKTLGEIDGEFLKYPILSQVEVFDGGPVAKNRVSIAVWTDEHEGANDFSFGLTAEKAEKMLSKNPSAKAAAFIGYSGWGENQLNAEIAEGTWLVVPADLESISQFDPFELWEELLMDQNPIYQKLPEPPERSENEN
ncbi:MAG: YqgE/AlgH family protein [Opitutales bacterium]|nr:YqgE/AlgH family protein [Opitutales bacterium]